MKRTTILFFLLLSITAKLFSQELNLGFEFGLGSYKMQDLKEINDNNLNSLPFDARITDNFPLYYYYKPSLMFSISSAISLGIAWSYHSTGSRISLVDYSGEYAFDTRIRSSSPAVIAEFSYPVTVFRIAFSNEVGIESSTADFNELLRIGTQIDKTNYIFKSINVYYEPALKIKYPLAAFRFDLVLGYHIDLSEENLSKSDNSKIHLQLSDNRLARANWSGVRLGAGISYTLFKRAVSPKELGK
jgi:hypothetical protein